MAWEKIARVLRRPPRVVGVLAWTVFMNSLVKLPQAIARGEQKQAVYNAVQRKWVRGVLRTFGIRVTVLPAPPAPATGPRLVISSHRSVTDIPILLAQFYGSILSRADLAGWPILGKAARDAGCIFVERDQKSSRSNAVQAIRQRLMEGGTVMLFPEGTVAQGDELLPFRRGAFAPACELGAEIVPVAIAYPPGAVWSEDTFLSHLSNVAARPAIDVVMLIGEPLRASGTPEALAERVQATVQALLHRAQEIRRQNAQR